MLCPFHASTLDLMSLYYM